MYAANRGRRRFTPGPAVWCRRPPILGVTDGPRGFTSRTLQTPAGLPPGYHQLTLETDGGAFETCVISAPMSAGVSRVPSATDAVELAAGKLSSPATRSWGCFLPLYAARSPRNWGAGDFTDLANLSRWVHSLGGRFVGTLPLLAAFLDDPFEPSPYAPASRLFWNEFYVDVEGIPELQDCAAARDFARR